MTFATGLKTGLAGGLVAAIVNVIIFYVGNVPQDVLTTMDQPIPVGLVGFASFFMVTLGGIAMYLLRDRANAFRNLAIVVTLLSLISPFAQITDPPTSMLVTLIAMHLVAGAVAIFDLPRIAKRLGDRAAA